MRHETDPHGWRRVADTAAPGIHHQAQAVHRRPVQFDIVRSHFALRRLQPVDHRFRQLFPVLLLMAAMPAKPVRPELRCGEILYG